MGIGLVDPILPALASRLKASPAQVELLFTSYLVVTALAMLITGWVSSRIGAKRTLIAGLAGAWATRCSSPLRWPSSWAHNTLVTTAVMSISRVPRGVASATYGFVRFIGGGLAPYAAGKMVEHFNVHVPVPVAGPIRMGQAGQLATVTSVPLTVTTAAGVDASRHRV